MPEANNKINRIRGWIYYDAACAACVRGRTRAGRLFQSRGFEWLPLQTPGAAARLGVPESALEMRMHLLKADGHVLHNADALGVLCRSVWWLWPVGALLAAPGFREFGRAVYNWFARHRYGFGGACRVQPHVRGRIGTLDWTIALFLPLFAGFACWNLPAWVLMWGLVCALGFALKWLAWRDAICHGACPSSGRPTIWFTAWPGLDGRAFFAKDAGVKRPELVEWFWAGLMITCGTALIGGAVPRLMAGHQAYAAWVGMVGVALFLHFGVIRLLSVLWRQFGINAPPIMNAPFRATSLAEFWGVRWNTAFSIPAKRFLFLPLARHVGLPEAGFLVFLVSGVLHEMVISLPARAGFGLPTLYFVLQAAGVAFERTRAGQGLGLGRGFNGWAFVFLLVIGPLYWLFHPPFVNRVIIPFLTFLNNS